MKTLIKKIIHSGEIYSWLLAGFTFSLIAVMWKENKILVYALPQVAVVMAQLIYLLIEKQKFFSIKLLYSEIVINLAYFSSYEFFLFFMKSGLSNN